MFEMQANSSNRKSIIWFDLNSYIKTLTRSFSLDFVVGIWLLHEKVTQTLIHFGTDTKKALTSTHLRDENQMQEMKKREGEWVDIGKTSTLHKSKTYLLTCTHPVVFLCVQTFCIVGLSMEMLCCESATLFKYFTVYPKHLWIRSG